MSGTDFRVVLVTVPDPALAEKLASELVEAKLAACVNVVPGAVSHYMWEGKLRKDPESLLVIKSRGGLFPVLCQFVRDRHSAKVPEIICLPIVDGDRAYLDWLGANTRMARPAERGPAFPL